MYYWIVDVLRIPTVYHLSFLGLQIKSYDFSKTWIKSDSKNLFEFYFGSDRATWRVPTSRYRFVWILIVSRRI
jgi:hypothetical protein